MAIMINKSPTLSNTLTELRRTLTEEEQALLIARLHPDRELARQIYQELRDKLLIFFECRDCAFPEELADETLYRIASDIWAGAQIADLDRYALSAARSILKDLPPRSARTSSSLEQTQVSSSEEERRRSFLKRCLLDLSPEERDLLIEYYQGKKHDISIHREEMAERLGMSPGGLDLHIHRLREKLASALKTYLGRSS